MFYSCQANEHGVFKFNTEVNHEVKGSRDTPV